LFSPKSRWPAAQAARTWSGPNVFDTATSRASSGRRPARRAASAIRDRIAARFAAMVASSVNSRLGPSRHLIAAMTPFACSAYCPVGASFRYSSKWGFASGSLPSFTSDIPSQ